MISAWAQFLGATIVVVAAGFYLARHADAIARETGMGRLRVGLILLATATSLPEIVTGVGAVVVAHSPNLAAGGAFGSNVFNLLLIALLALHPRWGLLLATRSRVVPGLARDGILLILLAMAILLLSRDALGLPLPLLIIIPITLPVAYVAAVYRSFGEVDSITEMERLGTAPDEAQVDTDTTSLRRAWGAYAASAAVVVVSSLWLADNANLVAIEMNWSRTFMGSALMAASTSLPELAVAVAALQMRAPRLALANLLGSNMFNMGGVLAVDAAASGTNGLFNRISSEHITTGVAAIVMTLMLLYGPLLLNRRTVGRIDRTGYIRAAAFVVIFAAANVTVFITT